MNKRFIITGLLVVASLLFLGIFSQSDKVDPVFQTLVVSVAFFLVVPLLYSKIVLKESLKNLGWQSGNLFLGVFTSIISVGVAFALVLLLSRYTSFSTEYLFPVVVQTNFLWFLGYELLLVTAITLLYEVFFRGLVELLWLRSLGIWAILFQTGLFALLLYLAGDISWQQAPILLFCPFAGLIAYSSRSIWYSWGASWTFLFLTDVFLLMRQ
ncbi:MAG: hypothetical protein Q8O53_00200 [Candidatus Moranbacteria bacterium]|nr:hypothetical protein [Candidatus Moranbacteria bacterium]